MSDDEDFSLEGGLFDEPQDFRPPPPEEHFVEFERIIDSNKNLNNPNIEKINLKLVGKSPLWGHLLWNAGKYTAKYLEDNSDILIKGKKIVEFGSAAALPSLICGLNDAKIVIATDYPDPELLNNIDYNIEHSGYDKMNKIVSSHGFIWGNDVTPIVEDLQKKLSSTSEDDKFFDLLILSDLVFNHTEHRKLLKSSKELIKPLEDKNKPRSGGKCFVVFSPHRPHLLKEDLDFFELAKEEYGFDVEKIEMIHWDVPMFPDDEKETEEIRRRIYSYILHPTW
ncbi:hypothetical protein B5S28_g2902 [[Candida] boidinii]|nr:hypothetical protein B5S28_g2902 [[Candida] boidinii]OWB62873.1 hypothetical protein B5S29_g3821 [[Candida] boidinii]OWB73041.1 hypothetical protein B5S31_g2773 [[Candida] boidinii]